MGRRDRMGMIEFNFLFKLFALCGDNTSGEYNIYEIGRDCGCSVNETKQIAEGLSRLNLVYNKRGFDEVSITPKGVALMKTGNLFDQSLQSGISL